MAFRTKSKRKGTIRHNSKCQMQPRMHSDRCNFAHKKHTCTFISRETKKCGQNRLLHHSQPMNFSAHPCRQGRRQGVCLGGGGGQNAASSTEMLRQPEKVAERIGGINGLRHTFFSDFKKFVKKIS